MDIKPYITGLAEGEGCFCVSFNLRSKLNTGIEVRPSFSISQNQRNIKLLQLVYNYFHCGSIRYSKKDRTYKFEVRRIDDLVRIVIPHFEKYPLCGIKQNDFRNFVEICKMMKANLHRNQTQLERIIDIAYKINNGKRKYQKEKLLKCIAR